MGNIISFPTKDAPGEWLEGCVRCLCCQHEWHGVAPAGTVGLQCPVCSVFRGVFLNALARVDEEHWRCNCGSDVFSITRQRVYCVNCGTTHKPWD